jgi:hypothetical protein
LDRKNAKEILAERGFFLQNPVVITDEDYYNDYVMQNKNEVVFVLPQRPGDSKGKSLLDTAQLLMAITPNGI